MSTAAEWFCSKNGAQQGPFTAAQLKQMAASGGLQPTDLLWKNGLSSWVPANSVKGLFAAPVQAAAPRPAPPAFQGGPPAFQGGPPPRPAQEGAWDDYHDAPPRRAPRPAYDNAGRFRFDGGAGGFFLTYLLMFFTILLTLGIGGPWAICRYLRWKAHHTLIEGRRLKFVGSGGDLFLKYLLWQLLVVLTAGIYMAWMVPKMIRWVTENTDFDDGDDRRR